MTLEESMKKTSTSTQALIIGRFQPPCNHHVDVLKQAAALPGIEKLLVGIGVAPKPDKRNFLTGDEVEELLTPILDGIGKPYTLRQVPDINDPPAYCRHVESIFAGMDEANTLLFTDNTYTSECFTQHGHHYAVREPKPLGIRGTDVRHAMSHDRHGKGWQRYVPKHVADYLKKHAGIWRLKTLVHKGPGLTVDTIIEYDGGIVLIERRNPPFQGCRAIPGGFVDEGETLEHAARRETKEETSLDVHDIHYLGYSDDPNRDPRGHTITHLFTGKGSGVLKADDDAKNAKVFPLDRLPREDELAFDHYKELQMYLKWRKDHGKHA
jgi:8-oxo-dGTP diphosphatase